MITLYFHTSPNPMKVLLGLEEMGLDYTITPIDTFRGQQHDAAFRRINPNGKLPAITDGDKAVFDSAAILLYLSEKTGKFGGRPEDRSALLSWLMFIATGVGPYSGQAYHFNHVHKDSAYATNRYQREAARHYQVLDAQIGGDNAIVGNQYSIVDIAALPWIGLADGVLGRKNALSAYPNLQRWYEENSARPAMVRAIEKSKGFNFKAEFDEETVRALFPQNFPEAAE